MAGQQEPWYHGPMTAERATKICAKVGQNGAFLVRESQAVKGAFTLSLFFEEQVYHHRIKMTSENKCHFEATNEDFLSLKDIVDYFMKPRESLIHPLTIAIYPSLIKQMDSADQDWDKDITVKQPTYESVQGNNFTNSQKYFPPTPVSPSKSEHVYNEGVLSTFKPSPCLPEQNTVSTEQQEDYWPAPPPCAWTEKPEVKPKPKTHQSGGSGRSARPQSCYFSRPLNSPVYTPWQDDSSTGKNDSRRSRVSNIQRKSSLHNNFSCMQIKEKTETAVSPRNNEIPRTVSTTAIATGTSSSSQTRKTKKNSTKTSPFKAFTQIFRKKKQQPSQVYDNDPDYIPIICKTKFVATIDYPGQPGAMAFEKGTDMVIKGVRVDGWWYCLNKLTQESNWVFQDYLKPKSEGEWFEAKPVETKDDQRVYETFDGDSDFDDDNENYRRYLLPEDDPSGPWEDVTANTGGGGSQRRDEEYEEHEDVKGGLINNASTVEEITLSGTTASADSALNSSDKEVNGVDIKLGKSDEQQAVNGEQPRTKQQLNYLTEKSSVRRRTRKGGKTMGLMSLKLRESLKCIKYIKGFGVVDKKLAIHVLEDHEKEAEQFIKNALKKHPFPGEWFIKTFRKTDHVQIYSNSVGGYSLHRHCDVLLNNCIIEGTIGCFIQLQKSEEDEDHSLDGQTYAVTCHHVVKPDENDNFVSFKTTVDDGEPNELKEFSKEIGLHMFDTTVPVDIAFLPVSKSCDAFNFEHDECEVYDDKISELKDKKVQKQGAITGLTVGKIIRTGFVWEIERRWYDDVIVVESCLPDQVFSQPGDSGSIITLCRNSGEETHEAVSMVFGGGEVNFNNGEKVSFTFPLFEAIEQLLDEYHIDIDYAILSKLGSKALDKSEENSKNIEEKRDKSRTTASADIVGLRESEVEEIGSAEPSSNRIGVCKENFNNTVEKIQSGTKASGGPTVLDGIKDDRIAFAKSNPNTNELMLKQSETRKGIATVESSSNKSISC